MSKKIEYEFDRDKTIESIVYIMNEIFDENDIKKLCVAIVGIIEKKPNESAETH